MTATIKQDWIKSMGREIAHMTPAQVEAAENDAWHEEVTDAMFTLMRDSGRLYDDFSGDRAVFGEAQDMLSDARSLADKIRKEEVQG